MVFSFAIINSKAGPAWAAGEKPSTKTKATNKTQYEAIERIMTPRVVKADPATAFLPARHPPLKNSFSLGSGQFFKLHAHQELQLGFRQIHGVHRRMIVELGLEIGRHGLD